ncbi:MAG: hypothetical protein ACOC9P_01920 [bacterium]
MSLHAGFCEVSITPQRFPIRTYWSTVETVVDPLYAHAAVIHDGTTVVAFLSLDLVIVEYDYVQRIRQRISAACPIPGECIMVCATHNHACPAVVERPWSQKEEAYIDEMVERAAEAVIDAYQRMVPVTVGTGRGYEGRVSFNRRYIRKNGSVISQPPFNIVDRDVLFAEGIIDPEVGVLSVRDASGKVIGMLVNFACHAVHLMGQLSAGFPGVMCDRLKATYGDDFVCVYLNGACGNVIHRNYSDPAHEDTKEKIGTILADDAVRIEQDITYVEQAPITARSTQVRIAYREIAGLEKNLDNLAAFNVFQGLMQKGWYKWSLERLKQMHARRDHEEAELQVLTIGDTVFGTVPAEYFAQDALRIKEASPVESTFVVSLANGWLGYIPHREAFDRIGGHESTWCISSKMEPAAGDIMADGILELIENRPVEESGARHVTSS